MQHVRVTRGTHVMIDMLSVLRRHALPLRHCRDRPRAIQRHLPAEICVASGTRAESSAQVDILFRSALRPRLWHRDAADAPGRRLHSGRPRERSRGESTAEIDQRLRLPLSKVVAGRDCCVSARGPEGDERRREVTVLICMAKSVGGGALADGEPSVE